MDTNKDGTLTKDEFLFAAKELSTFRFKDKGENIKWNDVFENIDLDGDGKLDFNEFIAGAVDHSKMLTKKNLQYMFKLFDANNDGVIELDEFKNALPTTYRKTIKELPGRKPDMRAGSDSVNTFSLSETEILQ